jgi:hypothetical protein
MKLKHWIPLATAAVWLVTVCVVCGSALVAWYWWIDTHYRW